MKEAPGPPAPPALSPSLPPSPSRRRRRRRAGVAALPAAAAAISRRAGPSARFAAGPAGGGRGLGRRCGDGGCGAGRLSPAAPLGVELRQPQHNVSSAGGGGRTGGRAGTGRTAGPDPPPQPTALRRGPSGTRGDSALRLRPPASAAPGGAGAPRLRVGFSGRPPLRPGSAAGLSGARGGAEPRPGCSRPRRRPRWVPGRGCPPSLSPIPPHPPAACVLRFVRCGVAEGFSQAPPSLFIHGFFCLPPFPFLSLRSPARAYRRLPGPRGGLPPAPLPHFWVGTGGCDRCDRKGPFLPLSPFFFFFLLFKRGRDRLLAWVLRDVSAVVLTRPSLPRRRGSCWRAGKLGGIKASVECHLCCREASGRAPDLPRPRGVSNSRSK